MFSLRGPHLFPEAFHPRLTQSPGFPEPLPRPSAAQAPRTDILWGRFRDPVAAPSSPSPLAGLTSRVFRRICSRRMRKWPGSLLTSSCRLQQFRHSPAGKGTARGQIGGGEKWGPWACTGAFLYEVRGPENGTNTPPYRAREDTMTSFLFLETEETQRGAGVPLKGQ